MKRQTIKAIVIFMMSSLLTSAHMARAVDYTDESSLTSITREEYIVEITAVSPEAKISTTEPTVEIQTTETTTAEPTTESTTEATTTESTTVVEATEWQGKVLNSTNGAVEGPSGRETYYNLDMSGVISIMRSMGYKHEYWVRNDGVKMFGEYVMCAANLDIRPKGTIIDTTLGKGIVCDTGSFAQANPTQIDIAVNW